MTSMTLSDIRARHVFVEGQEHTQSTELLRERRSDAHKDRSWLIERLDGALAQNEKLESELVKLGESVAGLQKKAKVIDGKAKSPEA